MPAPEPQFEEEEHPRSKDGTFSATSLSKPLSPDEERALSDYSAGGADTVNTALRTGAMREEHKAESALIDSSMRKSSLISNTTVLRGMKSVGRFENLKPGDVMSQPGFMSTTRSPAIAESFANESKYRPTEAGKGAVMVIKAARGARAVDMTNYTQHAREREVLFPRNARLRFESHETGTNRYHFTLL